MASQQPKDLAALAAELRRGGEAERRALAHMDRAWRIHKARRHTVAPLLGRPRGQRSRERRDDHGSRRASGIRSGQDPGDDPDLASAAHSRPLSAKPTLYPKEIRQHELDRRTSRSGSPALIFLAHPRYGRVHAALARFLREVGG
jgi:hypothetical protein